MSMQPLNPNGNAGFYPYVGIPTFLRSPIAESAEGSDIAVLGVPIDEGSPFVPGSRFGPRAIREHSMRFVSAPDSLFDIRTGSQVLSPGADGQRIVDLGDVEVAPATPELTAANITKAVGAVVGTAALPLVLGGDHSITYPIVRAFRGPLHVVQFDAHLDYQEAHGGYRYTNEHAFRQISHMESVASLTAVGIRSLRTSASHYRASIEDRNRIVAPHELRALGAQGLVELLPADVPCYVSIDIDALDHALVAGCVSAEPGGLSYDELREALVALAERVHIVGLDLVEVNPMVDTAAGATAYLAAHLLVETLGAICRQPRWSEHHAAGSPVV
jgi:agmatinase